MNAVKPNTYDANTHAAEASSAEKRGDMGRRYTYLDCIRGTIPLPRNVNGSTIFQILMVGGMVTFMVTFNGLRNTGLGFVASSHWLYPLMFALAFLVRTFIGGPLANAISRRLVLPRFTGIARSVGMTAVNVCCMAPIMCALATLLLCGPSDFVARYATALPLMAVLAGFVNFFLVGPVAKLAFNRIAPANGLNLLGNLEQNAPLLARMLGC